MTPEQIEFHRKRFEESMLLTNDWSRKDFKNVLGDYYDWQVQAMFQGYLMAIESSLQEYLEQAFMAGQIDAGIDPSYSSAKAYAQSLGLKVKE